MMGRLELGLVCTFALLVGVAGVSAQEAAPPTAMGTVTGLVLDAKSGDPIIDAGVEVVGKGRTVRTDLDGRYTLKLPVGTYDLRVFAPEYQGARLEKLNILPNGVSRGDASLNPLSAQAGVETVEVVAQAAKAAEATQLLKRKKAAVVEDNISAETIKKSPDSDAGEVVTRAPAVTVQEGKFIFVRGLGERYSSALLNGSRLPSTDPDRRVVPLDLFPADFLDAISIVKGYTPDLPGDFSGGLVQLELRDFPPKLSYNFGVTTGGNTNATFQDFDTYKGGGLDYFGFDQNVRSLPSVIPDRNVRGDPLAQRQFYGRAFKDIWDSEETTAPPDFGVNFSVGNTIGPVGFNFAALYKTEYKKREQIERQFQFSGTAEEGDLTTLEDFTFDVSEFETHLGGLLTAAYELSPKHRLAFRSLIDRHTTDEVTLGQGSTLNLQDATSTTLQLTQEQLGFGQVSGEHHFSWIDLDWNTAAAETKQDIPDRRVAGREQGVVNGDGANGTRTFATLNERLSDSKMNFTVPFDTRLPFTDVWSGLPAKLKFGPAYSFRKRASELRFFRYSLSSVTIPDPTAPFDEIFGPDNVTGNRGINFLEETDGAGSFRATEEIAAGYGMLDVPLVKDHLRLVAGVRTEYSLIKLDIEQETNDRVVRKKSVDPLPGVNLIYTILPDMNLRFGFSQTVSRPEFRELTPLRFIQPRGLRSVIGNPDLEQADVQSFDARWEWFFTPNEIVSVSGFYKELDKPIEAVAIDQAGNTPIDSFANAKDATLYGFEVEGRKELDFLTPKLHGLSVQVNGSWVSSDVNVPRGSNAERQTSTNRALQGQAEYTVNVALEYDHDRWGTSRLLFNRIGETLAAVGVLGLPDIFEEPRNQLDFVYLNKVVPFGTPLNLKFGVENLLNDRYLYTQGDETQRKYKTGVKFTFGVSYSY
jgi:TonB-dependent receptor